MKKKSYIMFIDSGMGGLHILAEVRKLCPEANLLYVADNKNLPFGSKTSLEIKDSIVRIFNRYKSVYRINCLVLACNTATACCIDALRKDLPVPIIGTEPNIKTPVNLGFKKIGILVTPLTMSSARLSRLLTNACLPISCPTLANEIEQSLVGMSKLDISDLLNIIKANNVDSLVLGCTHYNYIKSELAKLRVPIYDSVCGVAKQVRKRASSPSAGFGNTLIFTTSKNPKLQNRYINYYNKLLQR